MTPTPPRGAFRAGVLPTSVPARNSTLTLVRGISVGHAETPDRASGLTVVRFQPPASVVADVRGGATGTFDTGSLAVEATFGRRWALFLSGGSLYGLDAARGIRVRLLEEGLGLRAFANPNPVLPISGAILFDLPAELGRIPDYLPLGYEAARTASRRPVPLGRVGAGAGATVGKYRGRGHAMPGGIGSAARAVPGYGRIGVLVAVNAVGAIRDPSTGRWVAGARERGRIVPPSDGAAHRLRSTGTTLTVVATDVAVDRPTLARIAAIAHAGVGSAIFPFQSSSDGDVLFAASTGAAGAPRKETRPGETADRIGSIAAQLGIEAVLRAVEPDEPSRRR